MTARARLARAVDGAALPIAAALVTMLAVAWMWGGLNLPGAFHDERAYVVQARLLAAGGWTAPTPPVPLFWVMPHVFVEPALFAKYPPGFAPLLVPATWLGQQGLVPVLFSGISAALLVLLVRRVAGGLAALAAWLLWASAAKTLDWHASYFSETATAPLYLASLLALHHWLERPRAGALLALVACLGWLGITRPVTGIALGVPIAVVVLMRVRRERSLAGWPLAVLVGAAICAVVPYWSWRTTGSPGRMPYSEYSREYFPWDMPGFTRDTSAPLRELPPDFLALAASSGRDFEGHTPARIPEYLVKRVGRAAADATGNWAAPVAVLAPVGLFLLGGATAAFLGISAALMFVLYSSMPSPHDWTIYYLELFPLVAAAVAVAFVRAPGRLRTFAAVGFACLIIGNVAQWPTRKYVKAVGSARQRLMQVLVGELDDPRAVVFVRRGGVASPHATLWDILGPPASTPTWIVRDLGPAAALTLLEHAGGRTPYLLDESAMTLARWNPAAELAATHHAMP